MKQDLNRRPKPLRRTAARSFSLATKQWRFQEVGGRCEACGELIGDGTGWRRAIYHHTRLVSDPNVSDKKARAAANCMVLHPACHDDPVEFYVREGCRLMGLPRSTFYDVPAAPLSCGTMARPGWS